MLKGLRKVDDRIEAGTYRTEAAELPALTVAHHLSLAKGKLVGESERQLKKQEQKKVSKEEEPKQEKIWQDSIIACFWGTQHKRALQ